VSQHAHDPEVTEWLASLFAPDAPAAPTDEPSAPGNRVPREGTNPPRPRVDEQTAFVRRLFGQDPETGHYVGY
jgi:hypothetical protein